MLPVYKSISTGLVFDNVEFSRASTQKNELYELCLEHSRIWLRYRLLCMLDLGCNTSRITNIYMDIPQNSKYIIYGQTTTQVSKKIYFSVLSTPPPKII